MNKAFRLIFCFLFSMGITSLNAQSIGGVTSGAATYCSNANSGFLSLTGFTGTIINWESSIDGGTTWTNIGNITSTQSYLNLTIETCYRAIVQNGAFPPDTSTISCITVFPPSNGGTITGAGTFCATSGSGILSLSGIVGDVLNWMSSTDGGTTWTTISDTNASLAFSPITVNTVYAAIVQNQSCPTDTSAFATFTIIPSSVGGSISADDTVCYLTNSGILNLSGNTGTVLGWIASADGGITWTGLPGTGTSQSYSSLSQTISYAAIVQNASCPADTSSLATITVLAPTPVSAGNDTTLFPGGTAVLQGSGNGIPIWTPATYLDNSTIFLPVSTPLQSTTYTLTVTDTNGCVNSDVVIITVSSLTFNGLITTLFTPNGDGINDTWFIENIANYTESEVMVYNTYGQQVFYQKNYQNDWKGTYNGKDLPDGTYYFVLKFADNDNLFKGSVDILRNK
jgi:gliding motility-associated-like protein